MAKSKQQKQTLVATYKAKIAAADAFFLVRPKGVTVNESTGLKKELMGVESSYNIIKNTLFQIALQESGIDKLPHLEGESHAVIFSGKQLSEAAKILKAFAKKSEKLEVMSGVLNGKSLAAEQVNALADLPSKEALIGQFLSVAIGPVRSLLNVMNGNTRKLVYVLNAIQATK